MSDFDPFGAPVAPQQQTVGAPVQQTASALGNVAQVQSAPSDFDFGNIGNIPGVSVGGIGEIKATDFPVDKIKFMKGTNVLISIVTDKCVAIKTHYNDVSRSYICWGGKCCELEAKYSTSRYLFPIVVYDCDKKGNPISKNLEYRVMAVGKDGYNDLKTKMELNGSLTKFDILVSCEDEQYQKIKFNIAGDARWKKNQQMVDATMAFWKENMKNITLPVAKQITEERLIADLGAEGGNQLENAPKPEIKFTDVFSD